MIISCCLYLWPPASWKELFDTLTIYAGQAWQTIEICFTEVTKFTLVYENKRSFANKVSAGKTFAAIKIVNASITVTAEKLGDSACITKVMVIEQINVCIKLTSTELSWVKIHTWWAENFA